MKKLVTSLMFSLIAFSANAEEAKTSNLSVMLASLSNLLSSTNPNPGYNEKEPKSGEAPVATRSRVDDLPPLVADPDPLVVPIPKKPSYVPIDSNTETAIKLSPSTRRLLEMTPANIGNSKRQLSGKVQISHGQFDSSNALIPAPTAKTEPVAPAAKPRFELSVQDTIKSDSENILLDKALTALKMGQYESSVAVYKEVLKNHPNNQDALFGVASAYHKNGQRKEARIAYANLMAKYPTFKDGLSNVMVFASEEAPDDALVELDGLAKKDPKFAPIFAQKASIYFNKGDNKSAAANLVKALNLDPANILYKYNLATCYDRLGDNQNAIMLYNSLIDMAYKGEKLPVAREALVERVEYLGGQKLSQTAMQ